MLHTNLNIFMGIRNCAEIEGISRYLISKNEEKILSVSRMITKLVCVHCCCEQHNSLFLFSLFLKILLQISQLIEGTTTTNQRNDFMQKEIESNKIELIKGR